MAMMMMMMMMMAGLIILIFTSLTAVGTVIAVVSMGPVFI